MAEAQPAVTVTLAEWERVGPEKEVGLCNLKLDGIAVAQAKALERKLRIRPGFAGLEVEATSFVGHVTVGPLRVAIRPKLPSLPLTCLLRYAYGLRDLGPPLDPAAVPLTPLGLHDILVALLAAEVEELLHRGLARQYVPRDEWLNAPRGRILVGELARRGGVLDARLPCRHVERRVDWRLNQVLRAGLGLAAGIAGDTDLRQRVLRLHVRLHDVQPVPLDRTVLEGAEQSLTRLTAAYAPALALIGLLLDAQGVAAEAAGRPREVPGFLFDMNSFFQRLVSRFLHDNLPAGQRIEDERSVAGLLAYAPYANPKGATAPRVRPDYRLIEGKVLVRFLDAKYRDIWNHGCPAEWLYQLSLYALAAPDRVSVLLYATTDGSACDERIEVRPPAAAGNPVAATVILRPVLLPRMAELVGEGRGNSQVAERTCLARHLVSLQASTGAAC